MQKTGYQPLVHRMAIATCCVVFLPVLSGALVTTIKAGMAFDDWPTSDGWFIWLYPWLQDWVLGFRDKFVEHGHRLAGTVIGLTAIALVFVTFRRDKRLSARWLSIGILLAVISQGLLGGQRVLQNAQVLAMLHGLLAGGVLSLMVVFAVATSRFWFDSNGSVYGESLTPAKVSTTLLPLVILAQYVLGGLLRHFGRSLWMHLGGGAVVLLAMVAVLVIVDRTRQRGLRSAAIWLTLLVVLQLVLGAGAWVTRFGFPATGYVAVVNSAPNIIWRTAHAVVGMSIFAMSIALMTRVYRVAAVGRYQPASTSSPAELHPALSLEGGAG